MSALTYKCPNCGGGLVFDPKTQRYACEYCLSEFTEEELDALAPASDEAEQEPEISGEDPVSQETEDAFFYTCPSCGAQIATDETTAATFCYYCHNPLVLSGKLSGDQMPSQVIPFQITREEARERFSSWIKKKKYIPAAFFSKKQMEKLSGIYFPYWTYDCTLNGSLSGSAKDIRVWKVGNVEYTETKTYAIRREGMVSLREIARNALQKSQGKMMEGILPFDLTKARAFHTGYLSGFQAEIKDMEKDIFEPDVQAEADSYTKSLLSSSVTAHSSFSQESFQARVENSLWKYVLLPVWVLTYRDHGELYYFAMNGQTGQVCGRLPVDMKKLGITCAGIFAAVAGLILLTGGLIL